MQPIFRLPFDKIAHVADFFELDPIVVASICFVETRGETLATRYEPNWKYFKNVAYFAKMNGISEETEKVAQATSWGIMQVMGTVARELGLQSHLTTLIDIDQGLHYGCFKLSNLVSKHGNIFKAISAYNTGSPDNVDGPYVKKVLAHIKLLEARLN